MKPVIWVAIGMGMLLVAAVVLYLIEGSKGQPLDDAARAKAPGQHIQLTDGQLHYRWDGPEDGPVIVMVHGFSTPNFIYTQNVAALNAAGFRTLRFDHFGRGWSDRPRMKYDVEFYDRALLDLLDGLGVTQPVGLVGLSMGGAITAEFTARHPERVRKLFLFVPAGLETSGPSGATAALLKTSLLGDWIWRMTWRERLLADPQYDETMRAPENRLAGDVTEQMEYKGYGEALLSTYRHLPMTDRDETFQRLSATNVPVMAVFGDADQTVLIASAERLQAVIPGADVRIVEGGEHGLNYQRHSEVNPWLVTWFELEDGQ